MRSPAAGRDWCCHLSLTLLTLVRLSPGPVEALVVMVLSLLVAGVAAPVAWVCAGPRPPREEERAQEEAAQQQGPDEEVGGVEGDVVGAARGEDGPLLPLLLHPLQINQTRPSGGEHWPGDSEMADRGDQRQFWHFFYTFWVLFL